MKVTRQEAAQKLIDYLHHRFTLTELVDWAELIMMEAEFDEPDIGVLGDIVGRIGLADVKTFGMSWADCENFLSRLGYHVSVIVSENQAVAA
jgi:hypothetical protein